MKKGILLLLFSVLIRIGFAQDPNENGSLPLYEYNEFAIGASGLYVEYPNFAMRTGYGLNLHYSVHKNVALNWHLFFGDRYFSTSVWIPLGPLLFAASLSSGNLSRETLALLLLSALPDGVSFPLRLSDKIYLTPAISPLNLDMFGRDPGYKRFYINGNFALGLHFKGKYFNIHPYGAVNLLYKKTPNTGYSAGLEIELRLNSFKK